MTPLIPEDPVSPQPVDTGEEKKNLDLPEAKAEAIHVRQNTLLPCPFCGSEALSIFDGPLRQVGCDNRDCIGFRRTVLEGKGQLAIDSWNKRVERRLAPNSVSEGGSEHATSVSGVKEQEWNLEYDEAMRWPIVNMGKERRIFRTSDRIEQSLKDVVKAHNSRVAALRERIKELLAYIL